MTRLPNGLARSPAGLRALAGFAEIIRTGSATAAARNLATTQPAISRLLAQLEEQLGFELFYRDRGRLIATADAIALAEEVELALAGLDRVDGTIRDIATSATGELKVVAPPSFAEGILPDLVARFHARHPGVRFNLDSRSLDTTRAMIASRVADCGFMKLPVDPAGLIVEPLISSGSICVFPAGHPLSGFDEIGPDELRDVPLILLGAGRQWRAQVEAAFGQHGLRPRVAIETHTHGSACALAARGLGVAIVNALLAKTYVHETLSARPFTPPIVHEYALVRSSIAKPKRLTEEFRDLARSFFETPAPTVRPQPALQIRS